MAKSICPNCGVEIQLVVLDHKAAAEARWSRASVKDRKEVGRKLAAARVEKKRSGGAVKVGAVSTPPLGRKEAPEVVSDPARGIFAPCEDHRVWRDGRPAGFEPLCWECQKFNGMRE